MSERGLIFYGGGKPAIFFPEEDFVRFDDGRSPFGRMDAYLWLALYGPVPMNRRVLARQWRWSEVKVRRFIHKMAGAGLVKFDGLSLIAVEPDLAAPGPIAGSWGSLREAVFTRDGYRCTYCGSSEDLQCDHIHPQSKGGTDALSNLTTACRPCNASKRDRLLEKWRRS
jgi:hypothetical protein